LPLYAALTIFLFIVAVQGYFKWKKLAKNEITLLALNDIT
jgi:nicotinamide mononucleotide transporter